jgi:hypothetical protein
MATKPTKEHEKITVNGCRSSRALSSGFKGCNRLILLILLTKLRNTYLPYWVKRLYTIKKYHLHANVPKNH